VSFGPSLDIVLFELPSRFWAERLLQCVHDARLAWLEPDEDASVVGIFLHGDPADFARLLRQVQEWVGRTGLVAIRFQVDGRMYVLHGSESLLLAG
jgi:hypothetical protein